MQELQISFSDSVPTELWDLTNDDPKLLENPLQFPNPKSRDYQFGIALYEINSNTTVTPENCLKPSYQ